MLDHQSMGLAGVAPPQVGCAEELRMQGFAVQADAQQRYPRRDETPREFVDDLSERGIAPRRVDQPGRDAFERILMRSFRDGPLVNSLGVDVRSIDDGGTKIGFGQGRCPPVQRYAVAGSRFNARPNRSNKSSISRGVMISGGQKATTSPIARMIRPSS